MSSMFSLKKPRSAERVINLNSVALHLAKISCLNFSNNASYYLSKYIAKHSGVYLKTKIISTAKQLQHVNTNASSAKQKWVSKRPKKLPRAVGGLKIVLGSGFKSALYSLSYYMESFNPPPPTQLTFLQLTLH